MKVSKHTVMFFSLFILLTGIFSFCLYKYYPFLFKQLVAHCQHASCTFWVHAISNTGIIVFNIMIATLSLTFILAVIQYSKIFFTQQKLLRRKVKLGPVGLLKKLGIEGKTILVKDDQPYAFCLGFVKPRIIISTSLLKLVDKKGLEAILHHEKYHLEHKDGLVMLIARLLRSLFPFFPILGDQIGNYALKREISADAYSIRQMRTSRHLASALERLLGFDLQPAYLTMPSFNAADTFEARIHALVGAADPKRSESVSKWVISIFSFLMLMGLVFAPLHSTVRAGKNGQEIVACMSTRGCIQTCKTASSPEMVELLHPFTSPANTSTLVK